MYIKLKEKINEFTGERSIYYSVCEKVKVNGKWKQKEVYLFGMKEDVLYKRNADNLITKQEMNKIKKKFATEFDTVASLLYKKIEEIYIEYKESEITFLIELNTEQEKDKEYVLYFVKGNIKKFVCYFPSCYRVLKKHNYDTMLWYAYKSEFEQFTQKEKDNFIQCFEEWKMEYNRQREEKLNKGWERIGNEYGKFYGNAYSSAFKNVISSLFTQDTFTQQEKILVDELIKAGYKQLSKKYHPDIVGGSKEQFQTLQKVKEKLDNML